MSPEPSADGCAGPVEASSLLQSRELHRFADLSSSPAFYIPEHYHPPLKRGKASQRIQRLLSSGRCVQMLVGPSLWGCTQLRRSPHLPARPPTSRALPALRWVGCPQRFQPARPSSDGSERRGQGMLPPALRERRPALECHLWSTWLHPWLSASRRGTCSFASLTANGCAATEYVQGHIVRWRCPRLVKICS
jgi:hypothetical protein